MLWTMVLTYPLMAAVQLVSAQIGRVTGCGLASNLGAVLPKPFVLALVALLFVANTINIGADLAAMGDATRLAVGGPAQLLYYWLCFVFAHAPALHPVFALRKLSEMADAGPTYLHRRRLHGSDQLARCRQGAFWPTFPLTTDSFTVIVAVLGTTISPYMFFWQSSQEVEELDKAPRAKPLAKAPAQAPRQLARSGSTHLRAWRFLTSSLWRS